MNHKIPEIESAKLHSNNKLLKLKTYIKIFRNFNHDLRVLLSSAALVGFTFFGMLFPLFNIFLLRVGFNTQIIGQVNGAGWLAYALVCVPAGLLARRVGVSRIMVIGLGLMSVGFVFLFIPGLLAPEHHLVVILFSTILSKIGFALYFPNLASALLACCRPEERSHVFSAEWALFALGGFMGSLAGGQAITFLAGLLNVSSDSPVPYQYVFLVSAFLLALVLRPLSRLEIIQKIPHSSDTVKTSRAPHPLFILMASIYFLWMIGGMGIGVFFNVFLDTKLGVSISSISSLMAVIQLITIPLILLMPLITKRFGNRNTIFYFLLVVVVCFIPIASATSFALAGIFYLIQSAAASIARPTYMLFSQTRVVDEWRPVMSGAVSTMSGLGSAITSSLGGVLISSLGFNSFFWFCAVMVTFSVGIFGISFIFPRWISRSNRVGND